MQIEPHNAILKFIKANELLSASNSVPKNKIPLPIYNIFIMIFSNDLSIIICFIHKLRSQKFDESAKIRNKAFQPYEKLAEVFQSVITAPLVTLYCRSRRSC